MKFLTLLTVPVAILLGGCASTGPSTASADEESYTPTGTLIPRKGLSRADMPSVPDKQSMENDRAMGRANVDGLVK